MALPSIFAIYHRDTDTFQFVQLERDDNGKVQRLKNWAQPDTEMTPWCNGNRWFVVPTDRLNSPPCMYMGRIHDQEYLWWSLHHMLVWSNSRIYKNASNPSSPLWMESPSILVVEFNNKRVYPRENTGFSSEYLNTSRDVLIDESDKVRYRYMKNALDGLENERLATYYLPETMPYRQEYKPRARSISFTEALENNDNIWLLQLASCAAFFVAFCVVGLYIFIGLEVRDM